MTHTPINSEGGAGTSDYGPSRKDFENKDRHANVNPDQYAGQEVHPSHRDKFESREYQKKYDQAEKLRKDVEKRREDELEKRIDKERKEKERIKELNQKPRRGLEIPKQGMGRLGHAAEGLRNATQSESAFGYEDAFSMGGELGGMSHAVSRGLGMGRPDFSGEINLFGKRGRGRRNNPTGLGGVSFGGYADPFSGGFGDRPVKRGKSLSATGSLTGGIFSGMGNPFAQSSPVKKGKRGKKTQSRKIGNIFSTRVL